MSLTPPPPLTRRDWTLPIVTGVVAIVVVLAVCMVGSAAAFVSLRRQATPASGAPVPSGLPTGPGLKSGPECLIGDWLETSFVLTVQMGTSEVKFSGKGAVTRFATDGSVIQLFQNVVYAGSGGGNRYELVINGSLMLDYEADATTIRYSNPVTIGTSTLRINGVATTAEPLEASTTPETYACQGNILRLQGEQSVTELQRI